MIRYALTLLTLFTILGAAATAEAEDIHSILLRQVDAPALTIPTNIPYSYTVAINSTAIKGKDSSDLQALIRVDPSQPAGTRAQILSTSDQESDVLEEFLKEIEDPENTMEKQAEGFWCGTLNGKTQDQTSAFDAADFEILSESATEASIRPSERKLAQLLMQSDDNADKNGRKMMKKLLVRIDGQVTLSKPDAQMKGFTVTMTRPLSMMVVAKLKSMDVQQNCALAPNGFYHLADMKLHVDGKAMGKRFGQDMTFQISELRPLP